MAGVADAYLGQTLAGRYRLISHLADGGFSHVFKTADQRSGALVAVKVLQPDAAVHPESAVEFDHEGELLEALGGWCFSEGFGLAGAVELHGCR